MDEISQKIYNLLIEKAKAIIKQGGVTLNSKTIPNIIVRYSDFVGDDFEG